MNPASQFPAVVSKFYIRGSENTAQSDALTKPKYQSFATLFALYAMLTSIKPTKCTQVFSGINTYTVFQVLLGLWWSNKTASPIKIVLRVFEV
jgi:hypothetical protein